MAREEGEEIQDRMMKKTDYLGMILAGHLSHHKFTCL
jgi:hypothetical protein